MTKQEFNKYLDGVLARNTAVKVGGYRTSEDFLEKAELQLWEGEQLSRTSRGILLRALVVYNRHLQEHGEETITWDGELYGKR